MPTAGDTAGTVATSTRPADTAYRALLARLIAGEIQPGDRITVDGVSRDLAISGTPIREALNRLEADGLVTKTHLAGYRAAGQLDRRRFEELFDVRLLLEPPAAALSARQCTDEQRARMITAAEGMTGRVSKLEFALRDGELHDLIAASADNEFLHAALSRLHSPVHLLRLRYHEIVPTDILDEHGVLIEAIAAGNAAGAKKAMRAHLLNSRDRLRRAAYGG